MSSSGLIIPNRNVAITVACVHFDYILDNLSAVVDEKYKHKISKIEQSLIKLEHPPELIVFPEGSYSDLLIDFAQKMAKRGSTTICGTFLDQNDDIIKSPVVLPSGTIAYIEKETPSPFDYSLSGKDIKSGKKTINIIQIPINDNMGKPFTVNVGVLICFDFRNRYFDYQDINDTQLIVVPMFDADYIEAEKIASNLAHRHFQKTFLVNKAKLNTVESIFYTFPWWKNILKKIFSWKLRSSLHGPINSAQAKHLKSFFNHCPNIKTKAIWKKKKECIVLGTYELLNPFQPGLNHAYQPRPTYDKLKIIKI